MKRKTLRNILLALAFVATLTYLGSEVIIALRHLY